MFDILYMTKYAKFKYFEEVRRNIIMKKKISLITPTLSNGGAERVLSYLANYFDENGYDVTVYALFSDEIAYKINESIKYVYVDSKRGKKIPSKIRQILKLRKYLKNDGSEAVISFDRYYGISAALFLGKKVIASERNDPYSNVKKGSFDDRLRNFLYARTDIMVFQTEYAKGYFPKKVQKRGVIIPNPIPDNLPSMHTGERKKKIVAVSRLHSQKNIPMMFGCVVKILKEYADYHFYLYGDGPVRPALEEQYEMLNDDVKERFHIFGFVPNVTERILDAGMYISTSNFEGISNSMLEALALGIPAVCTDCPAGGASLAIKSGENGILVPVNDRKEMYNAMKYIIDNPNEAQKLSYNAVKIREKWSIDKIGGMWEELVN